MSLPVPGNYYIVNGVPNYDGSRLAINFNGQSQPLSVEVLQTDVTAQVWSFKNYDSSTQSISPLNNPSLQIAFGDSKTLTTLPAGNYVWNIQGDQYGNYTFQDGQQTIYWDLQFAVAGSEVTYDSDSNDPEHTWWLYKA